MGHGPLALFHDQKYFLHLALFLKKLFFSTKTYVVGTQKNHLNEMGLFSTHTILKLVGIRKYLQLYAKKLCLSKPITYASGVSI